MEHKSISAKISREEFSLIDDYCKKKGITPSSLIRELLLKEIKIAVPYHIAGANKIVYNKDRDNFTWMIKLDDDTKIEVIKNVSTKYIEQLEENLVEALMVRGRTVKKTQKNSVTVPSFILRKMK
jgi:hypothetical protein